MMKAGMKISNRNIAESAWGRGGTKAYRTNRKGVSYFSCSGHGGYVVPASSLTDEERAKLEAYGAKAERVYRLVGPDGQTYGIDYSHVSKYATRARRFRCPPGSQWLASEFFLFEEDCDWSLLETLTDIRASGAMSPEPELDFFRTQNFNRWHASKLQIR